MEQLQRGGAACVPCRIWKRGFTTVRKMISVMLSGILVLGLTAGCGGEVSGQPPDGSRQTDAVQPADSPQPSDSSPAEQGTAAALGSLQSFSAGTLDGGVFTQDDIAARDVTVVNFWSLTCGPCIAEMPDLAAFAGTLPENVQLITVCLDGSGNEETAGQVLQEAGFTGITLISGDGDLAALCGNLMYTPTTLFADAEGNLVGDAIIGRQEDLAGTFLAAVNAVLRAGGKAEISLAE